MTRLLLPLLCTAWCAVAAAAWPDLSQPPAVQGGGERDAVLIVGIEDYFVAPDVVGAEANAKAWYAYMVRARGVPFANVRLLKNSDGSREKILKAASEVVGKVGEGGTLWFVYIGHGAPARDGSDGLLVGVDATQDADSLYARSVPLRTLLERLRGGKQAHTVAVVDACFSGATAQGQLAPGLQPLVPVRQAAGLPANTTVLTAGTANEFAGPLPGETRPAFSYLMLGALRGWADTDRDGKVTPAEAATYSKDILTTLVTGRSQTPQLVASGGSQALAQNARERGPDVAGMVLGETPTPSPSSRPGAQERGAGWTLYQHAVRLVLSFSNYQSFLLRSACEQGVALACHRQFVDHYRDGSRPAPEFQWAKAKAQTSLSTACAGEDHISCVAVHDLRPPKERSMVSACVASRGKLAASCTPDSPEACEQALWAYESNACGDAGPGHLVVQQAYREQAARGYEVRCRNGDGQACDNYALVQRFQGDGSKAIKLGLVGCNLGNADACLRVGHMLTFGMYGARWQDEKSADTRNDHARGLPLLRKACAAAHIHGCQILATLLFFREGGPALDEEALAAATVACDGGSDLACIIRAGVLARQTPPDLEGAARAYRRHCELESKVTSKPVCHLSDHCKKYPKLKACTESP